MSRNNLERLVCFEDCCNRALEAADKMYKGAKLQPDKDAAYGEALDNLLEEFIPDLVDAIGIETLRKYLPPDEP